MIYVENRKKLEKTLLKQYPQALIIDVTSKGFEPYVKFSPFYPHGNIPIPFSEGYYSETVEGIWQGLKVFEGEDVDFVKFSIKNMKGIKRTVRKFGKPLGHRKGVKGVELFDYITARKQIYMKSYAYVLENRIKHIVEEIANKAQSQDIILLDYDTNEDIENFKKPLSHASLVKKHLEFRFPELKTLVFQNTSIESFSKDIKNTPSKRLKPQKNKENLLDKEMQTSLF
jgi:hypothetical protein